MNIDFINKVIRYKYSSDTFLSISPKGLWSIRTIDGNIIDYGTNLQELYKGLGIENTDEDSEDYSRFAKCSGWKV